jgi:hypothetical protein
VCFLPESLPPSFLARIVRFSGVIYRKDYPIRLPPTIKKWFNLRSVIDLLTFTVGTIFRLNDGSRSLNIPVEGTMSVLLDGKFWLHSIYWETPELKNALIQAFG